MTNTVYIVTKPRHVQTSVVKKSAPAIASLCARRKACHDVGRSETSGRPCAFRMRAVVERPTRCPTLFSAPWIRVLAPGGIVLDHSHGHTPDSASTPRRRDRRSDVHLRATNCRCHRKRVSAVTIVSTRRSARRPNRNARTASRRRSSSRPLDPADRNAVVGKYVFGSGPRDHFVIDVRNDALGTERPGASRRGLAHTRGLVFFPAGASAVKIAFAREDGRVTQLTVADPDVFIIAKRES
jgi:hypothetical protein